MHDGGSTEWGKVLLGRGTVLGGKAEVKREPLVVPEGRKGGVTEKGDGIEVEREEGKRKASGVDRGKVWGGLQRHPWVGKRSLAGSYGANTRGKSSPLCVGQCK